MSPRFLRKADHAPKIRRKLTRFAVLLVAIPILLVVMAVSYLSYRALYVREESSLSLAATYVQQALDNRKDALLARIQLFAGEADLASLLSGPEGAIAERVRQRLPDLPAVRIRRSNGTTAYAAGVAGDRTGAEARAELGESGVDLAQEGKALWLTAAIPLEGSGQRGTLYAALPLDDAEFSKLKQETGYEVSFVSGTAIYRSSLKGWVGQSIDLLPYRVSEVRLGDQPTFTVGVPLYDLLGRQAGSILLSRHTWDLQRVLATMLLSILGIGLLAILTAMAIAFFTTQRVSDVIGRLIGGAQRIGRGDLTTRIHLETGDEFEILADSFNQMTEELESSREQLVHQERMVQELKVAHHIQQSMLPSNTDEHRMEGIILSGISIPAEQVGGDYFDQISLGEERMAVAVGDVNGHGISSALMMALAKSCLHTQVMAQADVGPVMTTMNRILFSSVKERRFMTFLYGMVDTRSMELSLSSAGHHPPLRYRHGQVEEIPLRPSYPLGVRYDTGYPETTVPLERGDVLLFYTDGLIEARNEAGEEFGFERLQQTLLALAPSDAIDVRDGLIEEIRGFMGDLPLEDDMTLLVLKVRYSRTGRIA